MKTTTKEYLTPQIEVCRIQVEGLLCMSSFDNEGYGQDPGEDDSIF